MGDSRIPARVRHARTRLTPRLRRGPASALPARRADDQQAHVEHDDRGGDEDAEHPRTAQEPAQRAVIPRLIARVACLLEAPLPDQRTTPVQPDLGGDRRVRNYRTDETDNRRPCAPSVVQRYEDHRGAVGQKDEAMDAATDRHGERQLGIHGPNDESCDKQGPRNRLEDGQGTEQGEGMTEHTFSIPEGTRAPSHL